MKVRFDPDLPELIARQVLITHRLSQRPTPTPDYLREKLALQDLARQMADHPTDVLPRLVKLALELCDADAAGVSVLDGCLFRWRALEGKLAIFEGATTPRYASPCGVCLHQGEPTLMRHPERVYDWIADAGISVPEVLLVPLLADGEQAIGTLWIVAKQVDLLHAEHARIMSELASFAGIALHMILTDQRLKKALDEQRALAGEMSHRVKNILTVTASLVGMSALSAETKEEMAQSITGRIRALADAHGLVRPTFADQAHGDGVELAALVATLLRPYRTPHLAGGPVRLGERATRSIALVIHELATNAVKYGALGDARGTVSLTWEIEGEELVLRWEETGGPSTRPASRTGFGSMLVSGTVSSLNGSMDHDWRKEGLLAVIRIPTRSLDK